MAKVSLICAAGHACSPRAGVVLEGRGICGECVVSFDRVYLLEHETAGAIKVGIASGEPRVRTHSRAGYRLRGQWLGLDHHQAVAVERAVLDAWRARGWECVSAAPEDGRTETADAQHLDFTLELLGAHLPDSVPHAHAAFDRIATGEGIAGAVAATD